MATTSPPPTTMSAVLVREFGDSSRMNVEHVTVPEVTSNTHVLVKVLCAGVNPVDTYIRTGTYAIKPTLPYTPGKDGAGIVASVGKDIEESDLKVDDHVYIDGPSSGTLAQFCLCDRSAVFKIDDGVPFDQAACLGVPSSTAYRALFTRCRIESGESVLIHGAAGACGTVCVQLAKRHGCVVYGTASTEEGRKCALQAGCKAVSAHDDLGSLDGVAFDVAIEMLANATIADTIQHLAPGARVGVVGNRGLADGVNMRDLMSREACVMGVMLGKSTAADRLETNKAIQSALQDSSLKPVVGASFEGLQKAGEAHDEVIAKRACTYGRVVVHVEQ